MSAHEWKFHVQGAFRRDERPVFPCEAIIESGDRADGSSFRFRGVGPIAKADQKGEFHSWYVTEGTNQAIRKPDTVSVYVRVGKGDWMPIIVVIAENNSTSLSYTEMQLDLGSVAIPEGVTPYVQDA